jgi:S-adenosylmethionine hydrolase
MKKPIITLTTDFGVKDSYVAEMKGVILKKIKMPQSLI